MYNKKGFWIGIVLFMLNSFIVYAQNQFQDRSITQALKFIFRPGPATILLLIIIWILIYFTFMYFFFRRGGKEAGKTGKGICAAGSGLIVISMFAFGGGTTIIQRMQEIAGWINLMVGLLLGIGAYFLVTKNAKENNGFAKMFGLILGLVTLSIFSSFSSDTMENSFMSGLINIVLIIGGLGILWWLLSNSLFNGPLKSMNMYSVGSKILRNIPSDSRLEWEREWNAYSGRDERSQEAKSEWDELREFINLQDKEIDDFNKLKGMTQAKMDKLVRTVEIWLNSGSTERQIKKAVEYLGGEAHVLFHTTLKKIISKQIKLITSMYDSLPDSDSITIAKLNKYFRSAGREGFSSNDPKWKGKLGMGSDLEEVYSVRYGEVKSNLSLAKSKIQEQETLIDKGPTEIMKLDNNYANLKKLFKLINEEDSLINAAAHAEIDLYEALMKVKEKVEGKSKGGSGGGSSAASKAGIV